LPRGKPAAAAALAPRREPPKSAALARVVQPALAMRLMDITRTEIAPADVRSYRLLYPASWRPALNPYADLARRAAGAWFRGIGVVGDAGSERILADERPDLYAGFPYPGANFDTLTTVTKYLALWILFDDLVTERTAATAPELPAYARALHEGALPPSADPFLRAWWSLGRTFRERMSPAWCHRIADYFLEWLEAAAVERDTYAALRKDGRLPDVRTYVDIRSSTIGALPTFYFIELVEGFELPAAVMADEKVRALHSLGSRIIFEANDVLGLRKDLLSGWPNLVTAMKEQHGLDLAHACERVVDQHNRDVLAFLALEADLPSFDPETDPFVLRYLERMHQVICGFAHFERRAERYRWEALEAGSGPFSVTLCSFDEH
jgi:5-epi-alpha-selinene synthase